MVEAGRTEEEIVVSLNSILIGSEDPDRLATFYTSLFGDPGWSEGGYTGWQLGPGYLMIGPHDQVKGQNAEPGRMIWNLEVPDVKSEFDRMVEAGATVIREPYRPDEAHGEGEMLLCTFADPDGNYFQLASPMG
jgi:predicted enzyme related to lactoylglutathione lyase